MDVQVLVVHSANGYGARASAQPPRAFDVWASTHCGRVGGKKYLRAHAHAHRTQHKWPHCDDETPGVGGSSTVFRVAADECAPRCLVAAGSLVESRLVALRSILLPVQRFRLAVVVRCSCGAPDGHCRAPLAVCLALLFADPLLE